mmetsp:Transcript_173255/g.555712  ORF Transcript_173255/g.555712 Transcript_173255/m.555712 type:complete len:246 (-) Transcript_173255:85-822(-)
MVPPCATAPPPRRPSRPCPRHGAATAPRWRRPPLGLLALLGATAWGGAAAAGGEGPLGPGSEHMDAEETDEHLERYRQRFAAGGDALRKHGGSLACSACRMAAQRFQNRVARKIKGNMGAEQKREVFKTNLDAACAHSAFPQQTAVVEKKGKEVYVDWRDAVANREGKVSVKRMSPEVTDDLVAACRQLLHEEFREALLRKVLNIPQGTKGSDVDFVPWLCGPGRAALCDEGDDEEDGDHEKEEL